MPVVGVDRNGPDPDEHLVIRRHRLLNVHVADIGEAIVAVDRGFHAVALQRAEAVTIVARSPVGDLEPDHEHKHQSEQAPF